MSEQNNDIDTETAELSSSESIETLLGEFSGVLGLESQPQSPPPAPKAQQPEPQAQASEQAGDSDSTGTEKGSPLSPLLAEKARREREARAEIEALKQSKEDAVKAAQQELVDELRRNPLQFIEKYQLKDHAAELALNFYAAELGDDAPEDLKQQVGLTAADRRFIELEKKLAAMEQAREQAALEARNQAVLGQYRGYIESIPSDLPYLAAEAAHDSHEVLVTMAQVADHMYQQSGDYPSAAEVAKLIERQISDTAARYSAINKQATAPAVEPVSQTVPVEKAQPSKTLSTEHSGSSSKPPPVGEDELFDDAMEWMKENFRPLR